MQFICAMKQPRFRNYLNYACLETFLESRTIKSDFTTIALTAANSNDAVSSDARLKSYLNILMLLLKHYANV